MPWYRTTDPTWQQLNEKVTQCNKLPERQMARILYCSEVYRPYDSPRKGVDFFEKSTSWNGVTPIGKYTRHSLDFCKLYIADCINRSLEMLPPDGAKTSFRRVRWQIG